MVPHLSIILVLVAGVMTRALWLLCPAGAGTDAPAPAGELSSRREDEDGPGARRRPRGRWSRQTAEFGPGDYGPGAHNDPAGHFRRNRSAGPVRLGPGQAPVVARLEPRRPGPGTALVVSPRGAALGRAPSGWGDLVPLVIPYETVSRRHCLIMPLSGGAWQVEDLGSVNGTFVNGERLISPVPLTHGDVLGLGRCVSLRFVIGRPTGPTPCLGRPGRSAS